MFRRQKRELLSHVRCPECGVPMVERVGKKGSFYGCSRFPICIGTRPQGGDEDDSYTKLLRKTYVRALRFLSSPKFMGYQNAPPWLFEQAIGRVPTEEELLNFDVADMANEHIEQGIDAACAWVSERMGETVDFLINEHEERYATLRAKLRYVTNAEQIRSMPKPEILRRYDMGDLSQLEAEIAGGWKAGGTYCPRCNSWSESKDNPQEFVKDLADMTEEELDELLFNKPLVQRESWECGRCGVFIRTTTKSKDDIDESIEFVNDANDPTFIKGVTFRVPQRKEKTKLE